MSTYGVRVTKDYLIFSAGHFITFDGDHCERLHGHNWRVAVDIEGELDANQYVFDFITLLDLSRTIVAFNDRLRQAIQARGLAMPRLVKVEIEENLGQAAWSTWRRP
jgi:6-pyruvoyl-tetrahydropterin synthase